MRSSRLNPDGGRACVVAYVWLACLTLVMTGFVSRACSAGPQLHRGPAGRAHEAKSSKLFRFAL